MKKTKKNEELQTRREFFKQAAKGVLPILGVVAFGPTLLTSCGYDDDDDDYGCSDCVNSCSGTCFTGCGSGCQTDCQGNTFKSSQRRKLCTNKSARS